MIYLLDTDTLIFVIRGLKSSAPESRRRRARAIIDRCRAASAAGETVAVSAITVSELQFGARKSGRYDSEIAAVRKILLPFEILDYDGVDSSFHYGRIRDRLETEGRPVGSMDLLIAAHALGLGATIVTGNESHFSRIDGLNVENWGDDS